MIHASVEEIRKVRTMLEAGDKAGLLAYMSGDVDSAAAATLARAQARRKQRRDTKDLDLPPLPS